MSELWEGWTGSPFIWELGGGAIAGLAVGFAVKKATRLALLVIGVGILVLYGLMQLDVVTVHWEVMGRGLESGSHCLTAWIWALVQEVSTALVGFGGGFLLGLRLK
ncbi:MAG: hypothetical protein HY319_16050 [Armatimonadetes bacterium]|nr:hypothetical protein [Armatimonadota bacterium]